LIGIVKLLLNVPSLLISIFQLTLKQAPSSIPPLLNILLARAPDAVISITSILLNNAPQLLPPLLNILLDTAPNLAIDQTRLLLNNAPQLLPPLLTYLLNNDPNTALRFTNVTLMLSPEVLPPLLTYLLNNAPDVAILDANVTLNRAPQLLPPLLTYLLGNAPDVAVSLTNVTLNRAPQLLPPLLTYLLDNAPRVAILTTDVALARAPSIVPPLLAYLLDNAPNIVIKDLNATLNYSPNSAPPLLAYLLNNAPGLVAAITNTTLNMNPYLLIPLTDYLYAHAPDISVNFVALLLNNYPELFVRTAKYLALTDEADYSRPRLTVQTFNLTVITNRPDVTAGLFRVFTTYAPSDFLLALGFLKDKAPNLLTRVWNITLNNDPSTMIRLIDYMLIANPNILIQISSKLVDNDPGVFVNTVNLILNQYPKDAKPLLQTIVGYRPGYVVLQEPRLLAALVNNEDPRSLLRILSLAQGEPDLLGAIFTILQEDPSTLTRAISILANDKSLLGGIMNTLIRNNAYLASQVVSMVANNDPSLLIDIYESLSNQAIADLDSSIGPELLGIHRYLFQNNPNLALDILGTYASLRSQLLLNLLSLELNDTPLLIREYSYMISMRPSMVGDYYAILLSNEDLALDLVKTLINYDPNLVITTNRLLNDELLLRYLDSLSRDPSILLSIIRYVYGDKELLLRDMNLIVNQRNLVLPLLGDTHLLSQLVNYTLGTRPDIIVRMNGAFSSDPGTLSSFLVGLLNSDPRLFLRVMDMVSNQDLVLALSDLSSLTMNRDAYLRSISLILNEKPEIIIKSVDYLSARDPGSLVNLVEPILGNANLTVSLMQVLVNSGEALEFYGALVQNRPDLAVSMTMSLLLNKPSLLYELISKSLGSITNH